MFHNKIGNAGHFFVICSFVASILCSFSYYKANKLNDRIDWIRYARFIFFIHAICIILVILILFYIIYNNYFEYYYVWSHSDNKLPIFYMIACFWEGQEGSFLLWIFWHVILGIIIIKTTNSDWESSVMLFFTLIQSFLLSMILGVVVFNIKIGSSPFILLREVIDAPIFRINPNFIPLEGSGLNILLQNYWMVIHPPTLFLGFALTSLPFSFCLAGLWKKKYKEWVSYAISWSIFSCLILGLGIAMGSYWAYETLNFGGYWSWDPVENAVYIPWVIMIVSIHSMLIFNKINSGIKITIISVCSSFLLILYSTFLTRSGILGNSSVHSFTDLGLSFQLLLYVLFFIFLFFFFLVKNWNNLLFKENKKINFYSSELWILIGSIVLFLAALQVFIPTSIPVYNTFLNFLGINSNIAPLSDPIEFYTKFQLYFSILIAFLSGTGQFFWWNKVNKKNIENIFGMPIAITVIISLLIIIKFNLNNIFYILLLISSIYSIITNIQTLIFLFNKKINLSGGTISHIGVSMIFLGIIFSSGYSKVVSINTTGLLYNKNFSDKMNYENILLWLNEKNKIEKYSVCYIGQRLKSSFFPGYIPKNIIIPTEDPYKVTLKDKLVYNKKTYFFKGDTLSIFPENTYYEVIYTDINNNKFTLYPKSQVNPTMGLVASPDIKCNWDKDIYTFVSSIPDPNQEKIWSDIGIFEVSQNENFFINDYIAILQNISQIELINDKSTDLQDLIAKVNIKIFGKINNYIASPIYLIKNNMIGRIPFIIEDLGLKISLLHIHPETSSFTIGVSNTQKDYIVLKIIEKPFINLLWMGIVIMIFGFFIAIYNKIIKIN